MAQHKLLNNFTGGEITPLLDARVDLAKYDTSCRTMENMRPMMHGGATFRAGTLFIGAAKYPDKICRLIPFNYSTAISYVLEVGHQYMRFYSGEGVAVAVTTGSATFWLYTGGYTAGQFVQWRGVIYVCVNDVAATSSPIFNDPPDVDVVNWTPQTILEVTTPWTESELFEVQYKEINDVVYFVHPNHPPQKLTRTSATTFTLEEIAWKYPPLTDENTDGVTTLTVAAVSGSTSLTASASLFNANMVGAYVELRHLKDASSVQVDMSGSSGTVTSSAIEVVGDWTVTTSQFWYGTLQVQRSIDGGSTWQVARQVTSKSDSNRTVSGTEPTPNVGRPRIKLRLNYTAAGDPFGTPPWTGAVPTSYVNAAATLEVADAYVAGLVKITGYTSPTVVTVTVVLTPGATTATALWSQSEFSADRGYPRAIGLYEQRVLYAGTTARPTTAWGSVSGDFENFQYSDLDDGAVAYQAASAQQNPIQWLESLLQIAAGTSGEELKLGSGNEEEALTPANITIRTSSNIGSEPVMPVKIGKSVLFVQRQGKRIREYIESQPYSPQQLPDPADVTILAEHMFHEGIIELAYSRLPDAQVYAVLGTGELGVMAFSKEQNVNAWARYVTGGNGTGAFESVAAVYGSPADVVFVAVMRVIDGSPVRYIEAFTAEVADKQDGIYGMDCAAVITQAPGTVVNVGDFLEGQTVAVVADGVAIGNALTGEGALTVTGGQITLPQAAATIRVGIPYWGTLLPQKLDSMLANGTSQGRRKRISEICVRLKDTLGLQYGNSKTPLGEATPLNYSDEAIFRTETDNMDEAPPLYTGDLILPWAGGNELPGDILLAQVQPFPMTILGIFAKYEVFGD